MDKLLITGASGFLGKHLLRGLSSSFQISTLGRSLTDKIQVDISKKFELNQQFDTVIHAAGKAHFIPRNEAEAQAFFQVNLDGTVNLLKALDSNPPKKFIFISTVAVYGLNSGNLIDENQTINPTTPYAKSKALAENAVEAWCLARGCAYYILRLPLIAGTNPTGNLKAMQKAIQKGYYFRIGSGKARKSMVGTADLIELIRSIEGQSGTYNLTDGVNPSIAEIDTFIAQSIPKKIKQLPEWIIRFFARVGDYLPGFPLNASKYTKLVAELTFSDQKARRSLGWNPKPALNSLNFKTKTTN